jgi:Tfp pilus assembly protein PilZ
MFIATRTPFEPGTFLTFELQIPEEPELLKIRGEVRWRVLPSDVASCKKNISELECGMGIAFVFDSPQDRLAFENQVIGMLEEELGTQAARRLIEQSRWPE